jgi:hypothetical protein
MLSDKSHDYLYSRPYVFYKIRFMMIRACLTAFLVSMSFFQGLSQELRIGFESGIGQYGMNDLKRVNNEIIKMLPFDSKVVSDFPAYFYYEPILALKVKKLGVGLLFTNYSTGSRVSAKDYSGEYRLDFLIRSNSIGLFGDYKIWSNGIYNILVSTTFRTMISKLEAIEYFCVNDSILTDESVKFNSLNYSLEPGLCLSRSFNRITTEVSMGYLFQVGDQPFHEVDNKESVLQSPDTKTPAEPGWNGFRIGLSVYFKIFYKTR